MQGCLCAETASIILRQGAKEETMGWLYVPAASPLHTRGMENSFSFRSRLREELFQDFPADVKSKAQK